LINLLNAIFYPRRKHEQVVTSINEYFQMKKIKKNLYLFERSHTLLKF